MLPPLFRCLLLAIGLTLASLAFWLSREQSWQNANLNVDSHDRNGSVILETRPGPGHSEPRRRSKMAAPTEPQPSGYLINTPACKLPEYDPLDASISKFVNKPGKVNCNPKNLKPLTVTEGLAIRVSSDYDVLRSYGVTAADLSCCFKEISRVKESLENYTKKCDRKFELSECFPISNTTPAPVRTDGALVVCTATNHTPVYKNVHFFYQKENIQEKIKKFSELLSSGEARPLNVIIFGIDSTSRQNFIRFLPKSFKFLSEDPATLDFSGYNKVADNTDPNVSPVIMGNRAEDLSSFKLECYKSQYDNFDDCPFIWKKFASKGYTTVYAEDAPKIGLFHFNRVGFVEQPTDFYNRPHFLVAEEEIGGAKSAQKQACLGLQLSTQIIYDRTLEALDTLSDSIPVFGIFWTAGITHDSNGKAAVLDLPTLNFFQKFFSSRHRNNTIMLFFGDHGLRFGKIRSTYLGALEERLPFVRMIFPPWFPEKFKNSWKNLVINQHRLTNNYDLHSTLLDILDGSFEVSGNPKSPDGYGRSLFLEVPANRTCESAHIPLHFCACQTSEPIRINSKNVIKGAQILIDAVNKKLSRNPECAFLELDQIHSARVAAHNTELGKRSSDQNKENKVEKKWTTHTLILQTKPGGARFEGSVVRKDSSWHLIDNISRINMYGNQSSCVQDSVLKKFCYCI